MIAMSISDTIQGPEKLDSELLRTFLAVVEGGSFSTAAARIFRSQSAVSLQIKQLENRLGQAVFQRHARGVVLTPVGEKLCSTAQKVVALLDEAIGELRINPLQGSIRIGIPDEYGDSLLADVIAQFSRDHPRVELSARCSFSTSFPDALARNEIDIAVHAVESLAKNQQLLRREKTCWVTSKNHRVHLQSPLPVALFDRACWWRDRALEELDQSGMHYQVVFNSESVTGISAAVRAGVAVGMVGASSVCDEFSVLSTDDGFPAMPDSMLVLESRQDIDQSVALAMTDAICEAFDRI